MNDCKLCSKIFTFEEAEEWMEWDCMVDDYFEPILVRYTSGRIEVWQRCDDPYYTGKMMEVNYCPVCGRKLSGD